MGFVRVSGLPVSTAPAGTPAPFFSIFFLHVCQCVRASVHTHFSLLTHLTHCLTDLTVARPPDMKPVLVLACLLLAVLRCGAQCEKSGPCVKCDISELVGNPLLLPPLHLPLPACIDVVCAESSRVDRKARLFA